MKLIVTLTNNLMRIPKCFFVKRLTKQAVTKYEKALRKLAYH